MTIREIENLRNTLGKALRELNETRGLSLEMDLAFEKAIDATSVAIAEIDAELDAIETLDDILADLETLAA